MTRQLICKIEDSGEVSAEFTGGPLKKRELLQLLKVIKLKYRERIRDYRREVSMSRTEAIVAGETKQEVKKQILGAKKDAYSVTKNRRREN